MAVTVRKGMLLTPTVVNDTLGDHIVVSCGSVTGQLYLSKLSQSKKVNPRRACARVTVVVLSVCLSVCLCIRLCIRLFPL